MRLVRNIAFAVLAVALIFKLEAKKVDAWYDPSFSECGSVSYFDYGAWLSTCGQFYGGENEATDDLQSNCFELCGITGAMEIFSGHWENDSYYVVDSAVCYC